MLRSIVDYRLDPGLLALFGGEHEVRNKGNHRTFGCRIGRANCTRPKPGNDFRLRSIGQSHLGIKMADALLGLVTHPLTVIAYVLSETLGTPAIPAPALEFGPRLR